MKRHLGIALVLTLATLATWLATGRHFYTKFEVVEKTTSQVEADDPLAGTGFYDDSDKVEFVRKDSFHLGLIPTPQGLFDKHLLSVLTILGLVWAWIVVVWWLKSIRRKPATLERSPASYSSR